METPTRAEAWLRRHGLADAFDFTNAAGEHIADLLDAEGQADSNWSAQPRWRFPDGSTIVLRPTKWETLACREAGSGVKEVGKMGAVLPLTSEAVFRLDVDRLAESLATCGCDVEVRRVGRLVVAELKQGAEYPAGPAAMGIALKRIVQKQLQETGLR